MTREWKPGDVAMVAGRDTTEVRAVWRGMQWATANGKFLADWQVTARPLVVIDPEDREQVGRIVRSFYSERTADSDTNAMQAALREFADPKPPKPEEPTGLGAVVEDENGRRWTRAGDAHGYTLGNWLALGSTEYVEYGEIAAVRVLSEGVQA